MISRSRDLLIILLSVLLVFYTVKGDYWAFPLLLSPFQSTMGIVLFGLAIGITLILQFYTTAKHRNLFLSFSMSALFWFELYSMCGDNILDSDQLIYTYISAIPLHAYLLFLLIDLFYPILPRRVHY